MGLYGEKEIATICMADNGFIVKLKDVKAEEEVKKKREKSKNGEYYPMPDPKIIVAPTTGKLMGVLKKELPSIISADEQFSEGFDEAVAMERSS